MPITNDFSNFNSGLNTSRNKLLSSLKGSPDITFIYGPGNTGDHLIWEGAYQLLDKVSYKKVSRDKLSNLEGSTAILTGGGGWCSAFHSWPNYLKEIEERFDRIIIFPSSFDTSLKEVRNTLSKTKALVFAREMKSYQMIKDICNADYAYDTAFFYDFEPYKQPGKGILYAYREDRERKNYPIPKNNNDLSVTCKSLPQWLHTISSYNTIYTDRAHVTIASAMLGKKVYYRGSNYHKVPGIVEFSLKGFPVTFKEHWGM
ncbi:polysaccharide pyruvyl transferase family protein [Bacillus sp. es.034]|uniref:polysaccharide pyruvyl transferase family protein n=1 Tax=Bacillus sp. es.034 TaxID=1761763 RepID=UPI000BF5C634|nr:polysaccharide pyruvyl transferase family protein [Bacillus sp. es.034]PFG06627.1 exopolysaccharide biosynthesis predicted pyruvyl transferase EpsI [Bacillus sp. es.034]